MSLLLIFKIFKCVIHKIWKFLARRWRSVSQGWHWISASPGLARQYRGCTWNTWQSAHTYCSFLHFTQCAHTPHTPNNTAPLPGLAHWTNKKVSVLGSRVGCPQRTNNRRFHQESRGGWRKMKMVMSSWSRWFSFSFSDLINCRCLLMD